MSIGKIILKLPRAIYFWTVGILASIYIGLPLLSIDILYKLGFRTLEQRTVGTHYIGRHWSKLIFGAMWPWWRLEIEGEENLAQNNKATIIISNHQSMADIWALYFIDMPFRWVSKDTIFRIPIIGYGMRMAGYISVKRSDRNSRSKAMEKCQQGLKDGANMLFFPEGTRSKTGKLLPFQPGAFRLSEKLDVQIQPIVLDGAQYLLEKGTFWPGKAIVKIRILPLIHKGPGESLQQLSTRAYDLMSEARNQV